MPSCQEILICLVSLKRTRWWNCLQFDRCSLCNLHYNTQEKIHKQTTDSPCDLCAAAPQAWSSYHYMFLRGLFQLQPQIRSLPSVWTGTAPPLLLFSFIQIKLLTHSSVRSVFQTHADIESSSSRIAPPGRDQMLHHLCRQAQRELALPSTVHLPMPLHIHPQSDIWLNTHKVEHMTLFFLSIC